MTAPAAQIIQLPRKNRHRAKQHAHEEAHHHHERIDSKSESLGMNESAYALRCMIDTRSVRYLCCMSRSTGIG
jgi:hypothetical protein